MTILQQMTLFVLGLFALLLCFALVVKLRLLPALLWWIIAGKIFPEWSAAHPLVFYGVLAALALFALASWLRPLVERIQEDRLAKRMVLDEIRRANAEGRSIDSITIQDGIPVTTYRA